MQLNIYHLVWDVANSGVGFSKILYRTTRMRCVKSRMVHIDFRYTKSKYYALFYCLRDFANKKA